MSLLSKVMISLLSLCKQVYPTLSNISNLAGATGAGQR